MITKKMIETADAISLSSYSLILPQRDKHVMSWSRMITKLIDMYKIHQNYGKRYDLIKTVFRYYVAHTIELCKS